MFVAQKVPEGFANQRRTLSFFFGVASAFDEFLHDGLIYKIAYMMITHFLVKIIQCFLKDRLFTVQVGINMNNIKTIKNGFLK